MGLFDIFKKKEKEYLYKFPGSDNVVKLTKEEYESIGKPAPKREPVKISEKKSENNELWQECNQRRMEALRKGDLGKAAVEDLTMGDIRDKEGSPNDAMMFYLESFAFDCCGKCNISMIALGDTPNAYIAPAVVRRIKSTIKKNNISDTNLRKLYYERFHDDYLWPSISVVSIDEAYRLLRKALKDGVDAANESLARKEKAFIRAVKNGERK